MITIERVHEILTQNKEKWLVGTRQGNDGNQGNTLEDLLGVQENNLKLPDLGNIELKTQKIETGSFVTLFHQEPKPRASIPRLLLSLGWRHQKAGGEYHQNEMSFRSTTYAHRYTDRGFTIELTSDRLEFRFDPEKVNIKAPDQTGIFNTYGDWLLDVEKRSLHYTKVLPVYWQRDEFETACIQKMDNTLMCYVETKKIHGKEYFKIIEAYIYKDFSRSSLAELFQTGSVVIDFDARTRHNHGTKLRVKRDMLSRLFNLSDKLL